MTVEPSADDTGKTDLRIPPGVALVFRFGGSVIMRAGKEVGTGYCVLVGKVTVMPMVELRVVKMECR